MPEAEINILEMNCWNHLRTVWFGGMYKHLDWYLTVALNDELKLLQKLCPQLWAKCKFDAILIVVDKGFGDTCNYAKGDGDKFFALYAC